MEALKFQLALKSIINKLETVGYHGDFSDIGNEVGIALQGYVKFNGEPKDFIRGFEHGIVNKKKEKGGVPDA